MAVSAKRRDARLSMRAITTQLASREHRLIERRPVLVFGSPEGEHTPSDAHVAAAAGHSARSGHLDRLLS
jgi:hypothetical protein